MDTRVRKILIAALVLMIVLMLTGCALKDFKLKRQAQTEDTSMDEIDKVLQDVEKVSELIEDDTADVPIEEMKDQTPETELTSETDESGLPIKNIVEGQLVSFPNLKATDPDGDAITYTFTEPLNKRGMWQTKEGDAGRYKVTITASDGKNRVSQDVIIVVKPLNRPPVLEIMQTQITIKEGDKAIIQAKATDPDGDSVKLIYTGWMLGPEKVTNYKDAGEHKVIVTADDGKTKVQQEVTITVENVNRGPKIEPISDIVIKEGDKITIEPRATDPDGDEISFIYSKPVMPNGVWQTKEGDAGKFRVTVTATDGEIEDTTSFYVVVESLNKAPVITVPLETIRVQEGDPVSIKATVTDPENDELTISYLGWMTSDTYVTDYDDQGTHEVKITATDGINTVTKTIIVIVDDVNRAPIFDENSFE